MAPVFYYILESLGALTLVLSFVVIVFRGSRSLIRKLNNFFDDWYGTPGRDGVPPVPGVMSRMKHQDETLAYIRSELSYNSGKSVKDEVTRHTSLLDSILQELQREGK